jgi:hypothetical protein
MVSWLQRLAEPHGIMVVASVHLMAERREHHTALPSARPLLPQFHHLPKNPDSPSVGQAIHYDRTLRI